MRAWLVTTPSQVERVRERYITYALELKGFERRVDVRAYARTFRLLAPPCRTSAASSRRPGRTWPSAAAGSPAARWWPWPP